MHVSKNFKKYKTYFRFEPSFRFGFEILGTGGRETTPNQILSSGTLTVRPVVPLNWSRTTAPKSISISITSDLQDRSGPARPQWFPFILSQGTCTFSVIFLNSITKIKCGENSCLKHWKATLNVECVRLELNL